MPRPPSPEELRVVAEEEAIAAEFTALTRGAAAPYFARLRVRTAAGVRDVVLGTRALSGTTATMIDWQTAPLAGVFLAEREGDDYEVEVEDRTLAGTLLRRHLVEFAGGTPVAILREEGALRRSAGGWVAEDGAGPRLRPRTAAERGRSLARVVLDPVQRAAVDLPADRSLLVLGEAGFGKTTVALHRLAALARGRGGFKALVIVPTAGLRRLTQRILEDLEVAGVTVETFERWVAGEAWRVFPALPRRLSEGATTAVTRLKRDPAVRSVLPRIVAGTAAMREVQRGYRDEPETIRDLLLHLFGDRELLAAIVAAADGALPSAAIAATLAHTKIQFTPTTEESHRHVARDRLAALDGRPLDAGTPLHDAGTIDVEDFAVVFALHRRISGGDATADGALRRYDHVVVDEAQELAPIELELLGRAVAPGGTVTVAGDERQQVDPTTRFPGWPAVTRELGVGALETVALAVGYRCPPAIAAAARRVLDPAAPGPGPSEVLLATRHANTCHLVATLAAALIALREDDPAITVAIVARHPEIAERLHARLAAAMPARLVLDGAFTFMPGVDVTVVQAIKGLEFDVVVIPDADAATYPDRPESRRALHVAMTRAVHGLWLLSAGTGSPLLAGL